MLCRRMHAGHYSVAPACICSALGAQSFGYCTSGVEPPLGNANATSAQQCHRFSRCHCPRRALGLFHNCGLRAMFRSLSSLARLDTACCPALHSWRIAGQRICRVRLARLVARYASSGPRAFYCQQRRPRRCTRCRAQRIGIARTARITRRCRRANFTHQAVNASAHLVAHRHVRVANRK